LTSSIVGVAVAVGVGLGGIGVGVVTFAGGGFVDDASAVGRAVALGRETMPGARL
jgi:hypothetical protein